MHGAAVSRPSTVCKPECRPRWLGPCACGRPRHKSFFASDALLMNPPSIKMAGMPASRKTSKRDRFMPRSSNGVLGGDGLLHFISEQGVLAVVRVAGFGQARGLASAFIAGIHPGGRQAINFQSPDVVVPRRVVMQADKQIRALAPGQSGRGRADQHKYRPSRVKTTLNPSRAATIPPLPGPGAACMFFRNCARRFRRCPCRRGPDRGKSFSGARPFFAETEYRLNRLCPHRPGK